jgi:hypothetical protein
LNTARTIADQVIKAGNNPLNYSTVTAGPVINIQISDITGLLARIPVNNIPGLQVNKLIEKLAVFFNRRFGSQEGFYLIEHITLLPEVKTAAGILSPTVFLSNPYLYQLSVIVPDGTDIGLVSALLPNRLTDTDFRILLEKQFQKECPAHVFPFFIYPNAPGLSIFQGLYKRWRMWKHVLNNDILILEPIQTNLIQWLNTSNPKYPDYIN